MPTPEEIARLFIEAVNDRDLGRMRELIHVRHRLTDSLGALVQGRELVLGSWRGYFGFMPDYRIEVGEVFARGPTVAIFGLARGTFAPDGVLLKENRWEIPAAWLARIDSDLVESWQVYADTKPVFEIMERHRAGSAPP